MDHKLSNDVFIVSKTFLEQILRSDEVWSKTAKNATFAIFGASQCICVEFDVLSAAGGGRAFPPHQNDPIFCSGVRKIIPDNFLKNFENFLGHRKKIIFRFGISDFSRSLDFDNFLVHGFYCRNAKGKL